MKNSIVNALLFLVFVSLINACKKNEEPPIKPQINDNSLPSAAISGIRVTNMSAATLEFDLDITVFKDSKSIEEQLRAENFNIDSSQQSSIHYSFARKNVNLTGGSAEAPYSALMLMDQSGSISGTDPDNFRLEAAKAFCTNLGQGDNVMLWSFAGSSLQQYGTGFTSNGNSLLPDIESLKGAEGGGTPLYKSQYSVTNYTAINGTSTNKCVMTFTDGEDTQAEYTSQQVIANAISKNIKLYNVGLGSAQMLALSNQAIATGGAFMFAQNARQLISMFGNLGKMLDNTARYYHTTWRVTRSSGSFGTGTLLCTARISLPYNPTPIAIPFTINY